MYYENILNNGAGFIMRIFLDGLFFLFSIHCMYAMDIDYFNNLPQEVLQKILIDAVLPNYYYDLCQRNSNFYEFFKKTNTDKKQYTILFNVNKNFMLNMLKLANRSD